MGSFDFSLGKAPKSGKITLAACDFVAFRCQRDSGQSHDKGRRQYMPGGKPSCHFFSPSIQSFLFCFTLMPRQEGPPSTQHCEIQDGKAQSLPAKALEGVGRSLCRKTL
jgi:hypothetical protein